MQRYAAGSLTEGGTEGYPIGSDRVPLRARGATASEDWPVAGQARSIAVGERRQGVARTSDADPTVRGAAWAWLRRRIRCCPALREQLAQGARGIDGCSLRPAELCTW